MGKNASFQEKMRRCCRSECVLRMRKSASKLRKAEPKLHLLAQEVLKKRQRVSSSPRSHIGEADRIATPEVR